ncbi:WD40 repeat domain-containing protein [Levilinea saccharolytica]|uniref:Uncharacterized protein n=1 Tax=Levilinea saccharolytica TaxID=229921 RepID=A0A0N8GQZ5_9CHLR|nr:WD40 repeat domain-containing protein [Levilinea saccharolytica]KPL85074.1 hypothetical protein ADN01_06785 [Levilinea saccharolytica]GAP18180.1 protein containing FOG: WD40 repeat [Levilinea saccharolytica]
MPPASTQNFSLLRALLLNSLPAALGGSFLRALALQFLIHKISRPSHPQALIVLAQGVSAPLDSEARRQIAAWVDKIKPSSGYDSLWESWKQSRSADLGQALRVLNRTAQPASPAYALSQITLGYDQRLASSSSSRTVRQVIDLFLSDPQENVRGAAEQILLHLKKTEAVEALFAECRQRKEPRLAELILRAAYPVSPSFSAEVLVFSALLTNHPETLFNLSPEGLPFLWEYAQGSDAVLAERAQFCLHNLQHPETISRFAAQWAESRTPEMEAVLLHAAYVPAASEGLRLLCALKVGRQDIARRTSPAQLQDLFTFTQDPDPEIAAAARAALLSLEDQSALDALCQQFLDTQDTALLELIKTAGYLPTNPEDQAAVLFLTGQYDRYDALDFDQRLLRTFFAATTQRGLRQKIVRRVQEAGRVQYLTILTGSDFRSTAAVTSRDEASVMIRVLAANQEWEKLWRLIFEFNLSSGLEALQRLQRQHWLPAAPEDQLCFQQLLELSQQPMQKDAQAAAQEIPWVLERERLRVSGRVNDIAFSPTDPHLILATDRRQAVIWDYQRAQVAQKIGKFDHSLGSVEYSSTGEVYLAERTNSLTASCGLYGWKEGQLRKIGAHNGSITALRPLKDQRVLTSGRDFRAYIWDARQSNSAVAVPLNDNWPRSVAVSDDEVWMLVLHESLDLIRLDDLTYHFFTFLRTRAARSIYQFALFTPEPSQFLAAQRNGELLLFTPSKDHEAYYVGRKRHKFSSSLAGLEFLDDRSGIVAATTAGEIQLLSWPQLKVNHSYSSGTPLTSLCLSPDSSFLAVGTTASNLTLYDLRQLKIPDLLSMPLGQATQAHFAALQTLLQSSAPLSGPLRSALQWVYLCLSQRFRFDVEIGAIPTLTVGEFDILLEE